MHYKEKRKICSYLEVNPDFVSRFGRFNLSLLKSMSQGSQDTGRSLFQRTLRWKTLCEEKKSEICTTLINFTEFSEAHLHGLGV